MQTYTNQNGTSLSMAVWLATDSYDYDARDNYISATSLIKPTRKLVLAKRVPQEIRKTDVADLIASRMGTALHDSIESAWLSNYRDALTALGYPKGVAQRVVVNKPFNELTPTDIPVYLELRSEREIDGMVVAGKFDFVGEGIVEDFKSTGVFTYMKNTKEDDYRLQGSIYRWLNPDIITADFMRIQFLFTDWSKRDSIMQASKGYPPSRQVTKQISLMSLAETERWIRDRIAEIKRCGEMDEKDIPRCSDEDLWKSAPSYKYFKKPGQSRATRASDDYKVVYQAFLDAGSVGEIVTIPGQVKACSYCDAFPVCTQKDEYLASGELIIKNL